MLFARLSGTLLGVFAEAGQILKLDRLPFDPRFQFLESFGRGAQASFPPGPLLCQPDLFALSRLGFAHRLLNPLLQISKGGGFSIPLSALGGLFLIGLIAVCRVAFERVLQEFNPLLNLP